MWNGDSIINEAYVCIHVCVFISVHCRWGGGGCGVNPFTFLLGLMVEIGFVYVPLTSSKLKTLNHIFM